MPPRSPATLTCHAHLPWHPHFKTCQHRAPSQNARIGRSTSVAEGAAASSASGFERAPARGRRRAEERAEALERTAKRGIKGKKFYIRLRIGIAVSVQAHGSLVAAILDGTSHPGSRSSQMDSLLVCSTLVLVYVGSRSFGTFAEWRCF